MTGELALTPAQRGIVDAQRLWRDTGAFALAEYLTLRGAVDGELWARAVRSMVADTEAQRIRLRHTDNGVRQYIAAPEHVEVTLVDLSAHAEPDTEARALMRADLAEPCDPFAAVTARHLVLITASDTVVWYHRAHHVALDGYGFAVCAARAADHYRALLDGRRLPRPERGLADVVADELAYERSPRYSQAQHYWLDTLPRRSAPILTATPGSPSGDRLRTRRRLTRYQPRTGVRYGLAESVLAAVAIYVARRTGERDVVLGVPMMNRMGSVAAVVPAMILNAVALPVRVDPRETVAELAAGIGATMRAARGHARYRHELLRARLGLIGGGRSLLGPIVNIMPFDYDLDLPGIEVDAHNLSAGPVEDLSIHLYLRNGAAELVMGANPRGYTDAELSRHADAVVRAIEAVARSGDGAIGDLATEYVLVSEPVTTPCAAPLARLRDHARRAPHAPALVDGPRTITTAELFASARARARALAARGVRRGAIVAILPEGGACDVITVLAVQLAGAAHAALDVTLPPEELDRLVTALEPDALTHGERQATNAARLGSALPGGVIDVTAVPACGAADDEVHAGAGYVVTTSGSTGRPKAVRVGGGALAAFTADAADRYGWGPGDRVIQFAPLRADTSIEEIFVTLAAGACVIATRAADRGSLAALLDLARRAEATVLDLPTALWHELAIARDAGAAELPPSVRQVVIGGEEVAPELVARWRRTDGPALVNSYGPSEAAVVCACAEADGSAPVPLGPLFPHAGAVLAVDLLDPDQAVGTGVLHLYGPMLADGYLPADAGSGFREIPVGERMVRAFDTGDRVHVDADGVLHYLERVDDVLKIGGGRVAVRAIEDLLRGEPDIGDARITRNGEFALDALVTADQPIHPERLAAVRRRLSRRLPPAWVPARIIPVESLPRTGNRAAGRRAIPAVAATEDPATDPILGVFRAVLGRDDLTAEDDFFACGGTSMQTIALANRLTVALGVAVDVEEVLARPSAGALAARVRDSAPEPVDLAAEVVALRASLSAVAPGAGAPGRVLLTGGTGLLGAYLLAELLDTTDHEVIALVRAEDPERGASRLRAACAAVSAAAAFERAWRAGRLSVLVGDVAAVGPGVRDGLGHIVHSAAEISALRSYRSLRPANVGATHRLLCLARACGAALTAVSTATAAGPRGNLAVPDALPTGYAKTKSVAEHLAAVAATEFGVPTTVVRLGRVLPHPRDTRGAAGDFLHDIAAAVASVRARPRTTVREPVIRADAAARVIIDTTRGRPVARARVLDPAGPEPVALAEVLDLIGTGPTVPLPEWRDRVARAAELDDLSRAAVLRWCDIQLAGFDPDWISDHVTPVPGCTAADVVDLLGLRAPQPTGTR